MRRLKKVKAGNHMPQAALKTTDYLSEEYQTFMADPSATVGSILKSARQSRNETLERISRTLRISEAYLNALECDDRSRMPELVYTIGFLKTYALYLGIDQETMVAKFKQQFTQSIKAETLTFPMPAPERSIPTLTLVMIATGLAILIVISWLYLKPNSEVIDEFQHLSPVVTAEHEEEVMPVAQDSRLSAESVEVAQAPQETTPAVTPQESKPFSQAYPIFPIQDNRPYSETQAAKIGVDAEGIHLGPGKSFIILARDESWVEVKNEKGQVMFTKVLKSGESHELEALPNQTLSTGNAGGLSFYVNGKYYAGLGKDGEILKSKVLHFGEPSASE
jgi:cytoskeleton protein RodZ